ncbi:MAG: hypothetical protein A2Z96_05615 [Spirochaetes bacterium GWB1_48_6]|nr:MAG: Heavy metal-associated domain protein [Parcubacteria group bacterium GW2011_GWF2_46_8]OHD13922.1 MAG: hypothetical protein A2Z96_05615 [Spirochaetes bacterium GWB1_48_6]
MKAYTFHVHGMHCKSCVVLTESELNKVPEVSGAKASLKDLSVEVTGDFGDKKPEHIAEDLSEMLKPHGYVLSLEKEILGPKWSQFKVAFPVAAGFIAFFIFLQKLGVVNLITASEVSYPTAFIVGLVASVSTCMAVVGGLTLSVAANFAKQGDRIRPQILFQAGRIISFFVLGGVIGILGSMFRLGTTTTFMVSIIVAIVLLILGINLLDVFPWAKRLQLTMPGSIGRRIHDLKTINHTFMPFLLGVVTFFLPCGFTQSMQIYTLTTGSFWQGAFTMLYFSLGTFPVLAALSFGFAGLKDKEHMGIAFKAAGLVVIFFGILNLTNILATTGLIPSLFNF